jgi:hypothetical protein
MTLLGHILIGNRWYVSDLINKCKNFHLTLLYCPQASCLCVWFTEHWTISYQQGDGINLGRTPEPEMPSWLILCDGTLVTTEDILFWGDLSISLALSPLTVHIWLQLRLLFCTLAESPFDGEDLASWLPCLTRGEKLSRERPTRVCREVKVIFQELTFTQW